MKTREAVVVLRLCAPPLFGLALNLTACSGQAPLPAAHGMAPASDPEIEAPGPDPEIEALTPPSQEERAHISSVHLAKCGSCHTPVAPGSRARAEVEAALGRHRKRARLTDREWHLMIDYLTKDKEALSASVSITPSTNGISR